MDIFLTFLGLFGSLPYKLTKNLFFKQNILFHEILQSFPLISENRINNGIETTIDTFTYIKISKEFTEFVETKKGELDVFLAKLEKFDESKLKFKKKEITRFIENFKRILVTRSTHIQLTCLSDINTKKITTENCTTDKFEWCAFNYLFAMYLITDNKDQLYVFKKLNF